MALFPLLWREQVRLLQKGDMLLTTLSIKRDDAYSDKKIQSMGQRPRQRIL